MSTTAFELNDLLWAGDYGQAVITSPIAVGGFRHDGNNNSSVLQAVIYFKTDKSLSRVCTLEIRNSAYPNNAVLTQA